MANTIQSVVSKIESHVSEPQLRTLRRAEVGRAVHQGDVYLHFVAAGHPRGALLGTRQVAVGNTIGARHIAEGDGVQVYAGVALPPTFQRPKWCAEMTDEQVCSIFLGPVVVAPARWRLTHPEHAHHSLPACTVQVMYQGDPRTAARVAD